MRSLGLLLLLLLSSGCAMLSAADDLTGPDLLKLVAQENFQGCVYVRANGSHLGAAATFQLIGSVGKTNTVKNCLPGALLAP